MAFSCTEARHWWVSICSDLQAISQIVEDIYLVIPKPYRWLTTLSGVLCWFTVLVLKDASFCIHISPVSCNVFAFELEDPTSNTKQNKSPFAGECFLGNLETPPPYWENFQLETWETLTGERNSLCWRHVYCQPKWGGMWQEHYGNSDLLIWDIESPRKRLTYPSPM